MYVMEMTTFIQVAQMFSLDICVWIPHHPYPTVCFIAFLWAKYGPNRSHKPLHPSS